ncbi:hypothetical protein Vadar_024746 [Vaccinium darrowii]|uniref:Uncharacterized protein n=1 Tax=Vaccinium darrowii TaxID=229202 RepID=A0ACB7YGY4_9ERIC|nr:hypothetical protein Vadar_024746 [Vaccinium darrowii]
MADSAGCRTLRRALLLFVELHFSSPMVRLRELGVFPMMSSTRWISFFAKALQNPRERLSGIKFGHRFNRDEDELLNTQCPQHLELRWQTEVSSSIYATPLIADINSDGKLDILVPSFVHYLDVLEGSDGDKMPRPGWPAFHQSTVLSSPLLYDINKDGVRDIALATHDGEVLFFWVFGYMMPDKLVIPRLEVKKDWYVSLLPDPMDRSHPDVHDDLLVREALMNSMARKLSSANLSELLGTFVETNGSQTRSSTSNSTTAEARTQTVDGTDEKNQWKKNDSHVEAEIKLPRSMENSTLDSRSAESIKEQNATNSRRRLLEDVASKGSEVGGSDTKANDNGDDHEATVENDEDEEWTDAQPELVENFVNLDANILCTPVIADIDNDGVSEMIVAVSYFFNYEYYDNPEHLKELGGLKIDEYVAGGIVVFNLDSKQVKWSVQLDLSTDTGEFGAYIHSSPTVVDLDGDGNLDILVGTSDGLFYVLDHKGKVRENFPLEMAQSQGAMVAADINDDGKIELVTADALGNIAAWTAQGKEIWETHLKSFVPQRPSIGDVDGDGRTDVVVPTLSGNIYVLSGMDGSIVHPYPYRTHGEVMNQVLLVDLSKHGEKKKGLTIVTMSSDGYLYLIDGPTSCADVVDIGETSFSMVLAENVDGGDDLDLLVTTMNGNAWRAYNQGRNNVANRFNREGIYVSPSSRAFRDEGSKSFWVEMEIVDRYRIPSGSQAPYNVTTTLLVPGNFPGEKTIKQNQIFDRAGKFKIKLPTVGVRSTGTVLVEMVDKNGIYFSDEFSLTFHMHYYKLLNWLLVLPMLGMFGVLVILRPQDQAMPLPSFSRNTDL